MSLLDSDFQITISEITEGESLIFTIPNQYIGVRIDVALAEIISDLSRSKITNWLKNGDILVNGQIARAKDKVQGNEEIAITPPFDEESLAFIPEDLPLNVIYADKQVIVINKPAGLTVHPGAGNWSGTLLNGLIYHYPELSHIPRAGIVHRLDKDTSGLMVVARTLNAQISLVKQLQDRSVRRVYRAIVEGHPLQQGILKYNMARDPHHRTKMATIEHGGKTAITHYRKLQQFEKIAYIECRLETGRTHQIRVHMRKAGFPLIGDPLYGSNRINYAPEVVMAIHDLSRQALHAINLSFIHPTELTEISFTSRLPDDMKNLLKALSLEKDLQINDLDNEDDDSNWEIIYAH